MTQFHYEVLGAVKYPKVALKNVPRDRGVKLFANEFGDAIPLAKKFALNGHPIISLQGTWDADHRYTKEHRRLAIREARRFEIVAAQFPEQDFYYSPYCEHEHNAAHIIKLLNEIQKLCPNLILFNSPNKGGVIIKEYLNEVHGDYNPAALHKPGIRYMWACDGMNLFDSDIEKWLRIHAKAELIWAWIPQFNCRKKTKEDGGSPPPKQRKVKPVEKQFKAIQYMEKGKGNASLPKGFLYKSNGDQGHDTAKGRDCKPVLLVPKKFSTREAYLIDKNGKKVLTLKRDRDFHDGRPLFRSPVWGYEVGQKSGDSLQLMIGGTVHGRVDPGFRENEYRTN